MRRWFWLIFAAAILATPSTASATKFETPGIHRGRTLTYVGFATIGPGLALTTTSEWLKIYDFRGAWYDKHTYDEAYLKRSRVGTTMLPIGASFATLGATFVTLGPLIESYGLAKHIDIVRGPGIAGLVFFSLGAASAHAFAPFALSMSLIVGGSSMLFGAILATVQHGINVRAEKRLSPKLRERLYHPRKANKVQVAAAPTWSGSTAGVALVGVW